MTVNCLKPGCDKTWPRDPVLEVECPTCHAKIGQRCKRPSGHRVFGGEPHPERDRLADRQGHYGPCPLGQCGLDRTPAGLQHVLPGAGKATAGELASRAAAAPLKPSKPQAPCDVGLFSDDAKQTDFLDLVGGKQ